MKNFITRFKNARKVVKQIKNGEWVIQRIYPDGVFSYANRNHISYDNLRLYICGGPCHCEIEGIEPKVFGLFWRHYVWWAAARSLYYGSKRKVIEL